MHELKTLRSITLSFLDAPPVSNRNPQREKDNACNSFDFPHHQTLVLNSTRGKREQDEMTGSGT
eukprot:891454-Rhodomonas_salina.4